jgi:uncharacterized protein
MPSAVVRRTLELAGTTVPLVEVTGSADGPLLTVISGVHGCEYASMAAVRRWTRSLAARDLRGRVRAVPILNITGFEARAPFVVPEDGKNLNRCFPGDQQGTLADRLAHDVYTQLILGSDAYIDAHCGDMVESLQPFSLFEAGPAEDKAREMAIAYGLPYVIRQERGEGRAVAGTSSAAAAEAGIPAITAEAGGCGLVEERYVALHVAGLDAVLTTLGMADSTSAGAAPASPPKLLGRFLWLRTPRAGWWEPAVAAGDSVAQGGLIGTVSTLDGAHVLETVTAPADCVVIFATSSPAVADDGLLIGLGAR